jgi:ComF family protein
MRTAIHRLKYEHLSCLAGSLSQIMSQSWLALAPLDLEIDAIVPVPLHRARLRERGYNQSALLARGLGANLDCPVVEDVLIRKRETVPQVDLGSSERWKNVRGAFGCIEESLCGKRVLLVDDVFTTGSTLEAAGDALRQGGALLVWAYTLARAC